MRRLTVLPLLSVIALGSLATGCDEEFSDEPFGVLDLASVTDGGTPGNPSAGIPQSIDPQTGFIAGQLAEYYDFGAVPFRADPLTGVPRAVVVQQMFFFFGPDGEPLFSPPVREKRDGSDHMPGGRDVVNPNPKDFCDGVPAAEREAHPCTEKNRQEKKKPYPNRFREPLVDPVRNVDDFQRPIVDVVPGPAADQALQYTGLWELIEVTAPKGYRPDDVKHAETLLRGIDAGKFKGRATGKVINCPILDERTYVPTGVTSRDVFHPRIELWYRRKLTFCFLADGWETLGNEKGELFFAGQDDQRLDVFDVGRLELGGGPDAVARLVVPVTRAWVPTVFTDNQGGGEDRIRIVDSVITKDPPRRAPNAPRGYTPMRWMFDYQVPHDYEWGKIRSIEQVDPAVARPREIGRSSPPRYVVRNISLRGVATPCGHPKVPRQIGGRTVEQCGVVKQREDETTYVDPSADPVCSKVGLECNKDTCFCDVPLVGFAQACGPGIARCEGEDDFRAEPRYQCFPPWGGFCMLGCNPFEANRRAAENEGRKATEYVDSRCKGLVGYRCLSGWCLKFCDQNVQDPMQCSAKTMVGNMEVDIGEGQTCQDWGLEICTWPESYTPG